MAAVSKLNKERLKELYEAFVKSGRVCAEVEGSVSFWKRLSEALTERRKEDESWYGVKLTTRTTEEGVVIQMVPQEGRASGAKAHKIRTAKPEFDERGLVPRESPEEFERLLKEGVEKMRVECERRQRIADAEGVDVNIILQREQEEWGRTPEGQRVKEKAVEAFLEMRVLNDAKEAKDVFLLKNGVESERREVVGRRGEGWVAKVLASPAEKGE